MELDDAVFRALADPSRRLLLDRLFERDGLTLGELESALPQMTRPAVMKHLRVLERAGVVISHRAGRRRLHYLNPVPIRRLHDRWLDKFRARAADTLLALESVMEEREMPSRAETDERPRFVSQIFIRATPDQVWRAITDPDLTRLYYYDSVAESDFKAGSPYRYLIGELEAIVGTVIESDPPRRLVLTFDARWDTDVAADAPSRLTWELEATGPSVTKVTTIHEGFASRTATFESVSGGMPFILSGLKSVIETGAALVPEAVAGPA